MVNGALVNADNLKPYHIRLTTPSSSLSGVVLPRRRVSSGDFVDFGGVELDIRSMIHELRHVSVRKNSRNICGQLQVDLYKFHSI